MLKESWSDERIKQEGLRYVEDIKLGNTKYRGYMKEEQKWGPGTLKWLMGEAADTIYNGEFKSDLAWGQGEILHPDGE